tara:strand:+ start:7300 stop:7449 length:150 start_codon:yes stop_codon:yes gene_type:complete
MVSIKQFSKILFILFSFNLEMNSLFICNDTINNPITPTQIESIFEEFWA